MSPIAHREKGFEFRIYFNDHRPPHVHAIKAGRECTIGLDPVVVLSNQGLSPADVRRALAIATANVDRMLAAWNDIFPA